MGNGGDTRPVALVVEDDAQIALLLREILSMHGYQVAEVADGALAGSAIRSLEPAVVMLDVGLPNIHGLAVLEDIKGDPAVADTPIVVVTAWWSKELEAQALAAGAAAVLAKPFDISRIGSAVGAARAGRPTQPANH